LSDRLKSATIISQTGAELQVNSPSWFAFDYRYSKVLGSGSVLIDATFELTKAESERLRAVADDHISQRSIKHPPKGMHTAGSYFKNLPPLGPGEPRRAAGLLLDEVGARDLCVGDAAVFDKHANIVINKGRATAQDVLELTREMARRVHERFAIELIPEVRFVGEQ
jgi:UDP-N-acetylmuramate dehydrogenase